MMKRNFGVSVSRPYKCQCLSCSTGECYWPECTQPELRPTERDPTFWIIAGSFLAIFAVTFWGLFL
jgi:hypothetical protein